LPTQIRIKKYASRNGGMPARAWEFESPPRHLK